MFRKNDRMEGGNVPAFGCEWRQAQGIISCVHFRTLFLSSTIEEGEILGSVAPVEKLRWWLSLHALSYRKART
jgi:hypothetical protein